jgi:NAD(P)-dependent dehydrogenase (short-subunit alcohol dehydrogenase family)
LASVNKAAEEDLMNYRDRHVMVTGGTGALGIAVVAAFLKVGAICHVPYYREVELERFPLRKDGRVSLVGPIDLADEKAVVRLFASTSRLWASIHLAGGFAAAPIAETDKAALLRQLEMNFVSAFLCCREAVKVMRESGGGRIVNVAARPALEWRQGAGMTAYTASKAALAAFTAALAEEVVKDGILVNAIAPSILDTPANRQAIPKADFSQWPKLEEVADIILALASDDNRVGRGGILPVYGRS